jgi:hypothetical protein
MWRYTLTSLGAARGRLLLTAVAVALGVGAVSGTLVIIDSADAAADAAFAEAAPRVAVVVRATRHGEGEVFSDITGELFAQPMPFAAASPGSTASRPPSAWSAATPSSWAATATWSVAAGRRWVAPSTPPSPGTCAPVGCLPVPARW